MVCPTPARSCRSCPRQGQEMAKTLTKIARSQGSSSIASVHVLLVKSDSLGAGPGFEVRTRQAGGRKLQGSRLLSNDCPLAALGFRQSCDCFGFTLPRTERPRCTLENVVPATGAVKSYAQQSVSAWPRRLSVIHLKHASLSFRRQGHLPCIPLLLGAHHQLPVHLNSTGKRPRLSDMFCASHVVASTSLMKPPLEYPACWVWAGVWVRDLSSRVESPPKILSFG